MIVGWLRSHGVEKLRKVAISLSRTHVQQCKESQNVPQQISDIIKVTCHSLTNVRSREDLYGESASQNVYITILSCEV